MNEKEETPPTAISASGSSDSSSKSPDKSSSAEDKHNPKTSEEVAEAEGSLNSRPSFGSVSTIPDSSPPESPSLSPSSPKSPTSPKPPAHLYPSTLRTPQMMVLGKDGSDYRDLMASRSKQQQTNERQQALLEDEEKEETFEDERAQDEGSWWNRLWHGKAKHNSLAQLSADDEYTSMEQAEQQDRRRPPRQLEGLDVEDPVYYQGLGEDPLQSPQAPTPSPPRMKHQSLLRNLPLPTTREEQIQQDCSFLYRPVDENNGMMNSSRRNRRTLRAILDPPPAGVTTLYQDAQEVWSPPVMAQYKAKYQQLNEVYEVRDTHDRYADYNDYAVTPPRELTLEEQEQETANLALVASTVAKSSLFFQHEANGRVVLRLPRDHVRLVVANPGDLEPGILSVIQNRREEDPIAPTLQYCLTVPPDLYQKVISEMVQYSSSAHGLDSISDDHLDIKWAVGIMTIILVFLGINTLVFG